MNIIIIDKWFIIYNMKVNNKKYIQDDKWYIYISS